MCDTAEFHQILQQIVSIYKKVYGKSIVQIILYGSFARGDHTEDSDIDIVAIVHGERADLQEKLKEVWDFSSDLEVDYGIIISPTVIPYEEYVKFKDDLPYYRNIDREGVNVSSLAG